MSSGHSHCPTMEAESPLNQAASGVKPSSYVEHWKYICWSQICEERLSLFGNIINAQTTIYLPNQKMSDAVPLLIWAFKVEPTTKSCNRISNHKEPILISYWLRHLEVFVQPVAVSICATQLTLLLTPAANNIIVIKSLRGPPSRGWSPGPQPLGALQVPIKSIILQL